jgi:hypothetical protein
MSIDRYKLAGPRELVASEFKEYFDRVSAVVALGSKVVSGPAVPLRAVA